MSLGTKWWVLAPAIAAFAGCTGEAALNHLPPDAHGGPIGVSPADGTGGVAGLGAPGLAGASAPVAGVGGSIAPPIEPEAGTGALPARRPRPIADGLVPGAILGGSAPLILEPSPIDLVAYGYVEQELFLEGTATSYAPRGELGIDGFWQVSANGRAHYKTRLLVRRPADASAFNGTVLVEWLNVTSGADAAVGYAFAREELLRGGYAYVGVSAQQLGTDMLKSTDPARYGSLSHPGDAYAYDVFAQAGAVIGWPGDVDPMQGMHVERLIAYGGAQSAARMTTYVNAVQSSTDVFDGFIIHSRASWGAPLGAESDGLLGSGSPVRIRGDLDARVLQFFTESAVFLELGPAFDARQVDTDRMRTWEVPGTAHADQFLLGPGADMGCGVINAGPQHFVLKAAVRAMHAWLKDGTAPTAAEPLAVTAAHDALARDPHGNALGGIRTPAVDVPIATLIGEASLENKWNLMCTIFGRTIPFTPEQLRALYPTHQDYVDKVAASARASRDAGFILPEDEATILAEAIAARIPD